MARYEDFNLNSGQYVPQYAGSPLDEVIKTSDALQERHYRNIADLSNLQLLKAQYESKVTPGAKEYISNQFNDIDQTLQDIARNGAENSTAKIAALRNRFLGDQGVLGAMQRSEEIKKEVETENSLIAQGKTPIRKKGVREQALSTPVIDPETGKVSELYTRPYQSTVAPYENPIPYMKDIWSELHPDSIEGELKGMDSKLMKELMTKATGPEGVDIPLFFESLTKAGIDKNKITSNLDNAFNSYKETPAYKQAVEYAENPEAEAKRQKKVFLEHGLLKVFQNISREDRFNPIADDLIRKGKTIAGPGGINPDLSITAKPPATPIDNLDHITDSGEVKKGFIGRAIDAASRTSELSSLAQQKLDALKAGNTTLAADLDKKMSAIGEQIEAPDETLTKQAIPYYKAAASFTNNPDMSEDQLKKWAGSEEGKKMLQAYKDNVLSTKYKSNFVQNIDDKKARDAQAQYLTSNLSQRKVIPFEDPNKVIHMSDIVLDKGDSEALNISKWAVTDPNKIRFTGETLPQNWLGEGTDVEGEFTNAKVIEVPVGDGKDGKMKRYYISNLPSEVSPADMTEKALSNLGRRIPGVPNKSQNGVEVFHAINHNQIVSLAQKHKDGRIAQMQSAIEVKIGDHTIIVPDYKTAAQELIKLGIMLPSSK